MQSQITTSLGDGLRQSPKTVLHTGPNYTIPKIQRGRSGSYNCTTSNNVGTSEAATINVDVQCKYM